MIVICPNNLSVVTLHMPCASYMGYYLMFYQVGHYADIHRHWFTHYLQKKGKKSTQSTVAGGSLNHCSAGPPAWPSFPQWLLSADSFKAVDLMSVVHFWVSEQWGNAALKGEQRRP